MLPNVSLPKFITNPDPARFLSDNWIAVDFETTNIEFGDARIKDNKFVYGFAYGPRIGGVEFRSLLEVLDFQEEFEKADFVVAQNAKFEIQWMIRGGLDVENILFYDTMIGDYVRAGNRKWRLKLNDICGRYGVATKESYVSNLIDCGVCPSVIDPDALEYYCRQDVYITAQAMLRQRKVLLKEGLLPVFFIRMLTTPVISDMEMRGMFLDKDMVYALYKKYNEEFQKLTAQLNTFTGGVPMSSPQKVAEYMYGELGFEEVKDRRGNPIRGKPNKRFPNGQPKTDEPTLTKLKAKTKKQRDFLTLKSAESELRKKITTYLNRFVDVVENHECVMYGDLNQVVAQTHRLTSSNPNLQNLDNSLKKVVCPRKKGFKIRGSDYGKLEFVVAAMLAQDKQGLVDLTSGHDPHRYSAAVLDLVKLDVSMEEMAAVSTEARRKAKRHTFKPLYGGMSGTKEERFYYSAFLERYPGIKAMQQEWMDEALATQQHRTVTGLIFYHPGTKYTSSGYLENQTNIKNYPVQMFATADISQIGVAMLWHNMKALKLRSFLLVEIHDSAIIEEAEEESELVEKLCHKCMVTDIVPFFKQVIGYDINYPITIETESNSHWGYDEE